MVVGVDGSEDSKEALRWAAEDARLRDAPLRVIHAWTYGTALGPIDTRGLPEGTAIPVEPAQRRRAALALIERTLSEAQVDLDGLAVERVAVEGDARAVLVDQVSNSDLLVVGSRGRGGLTSLLLGSVSLYCCSNAPCLVVVVRGRAAAP